MKQDIFEKYVDTVASEFGISRDSIFVKTKQRNFAEARHILYYLCINRPIKVSSIVMYMAANGYTIGHSSIIYGIKQVQDRMSIDRDYIRVVKKIQDKVQ